MNINDTGVIILSGGHSSRMDYPKAFLICDRNPIIVILSNIYNQFGVEKSVVVFNKNLFINKWNNYIDSIAVNNIIVKNNFPELGRTYSIQLGLKELINKKFCFIQNVDNPDISVELLQSMLKSLKANSYVVACNGGIGGHPILISTEVLNHLIQLKGSDWLLKEELKKFDRIQIEATTNNVLLNINTQSDWKKYIGTKKMNDPEAEPRGIGLLE